MDVLKQATPYALLMVWLHFMDTTARQGPVLSLLGIFALLRLIAHFAGFQSAMSMVHRRVLRVRALVQELVERSETGVSK